MLDEMKQSYVLCERGPIRDDGLNSEHDHPWIQLRSLQYGAVMIWEQMQRQEDCDADDHVVSINGKVGDTEPPLEITLHAWQDDDTCYDCGRTKEEIEVAGKAGR